MIIDSSFAFAQLLGVTGVQELQDKGASARNATGGFEFFHLERTMFSKKYVSLPQNNKRNRE
jgi:hypothetical protein